MPIPLTFSPGMERQCFNVTITDDNRYEFREQFQVNITTTDPQIDLMPNSVTVMIIDDDGAFIIHAVNFCVREKTVWTNPFEPRH